MKAEPDTGDEAVRKATGRGWAEWKAALDKAGAGDWSHKQIVAWLATEAGVKGWWGQQVTVGYEKLSGKRVLGQTAGTGFQVGVRKTFPFSRDDLWHRLTEPGAMRLWLGTDKAKLAAGESYRCAGVKGELRVVKPGDRIRFTRSVEGKPASTVQFALTASGPKKTSVTFHHEKLSNAGEREAMRAHWKDVAEKLAEMWKG